MDTNKLLFKEEVFQVVGCGMEVHNGIGQGLHEKIYENALIVEFKNRQISFDQQRRFEVQYKGQYVGEFIPDLIVFGSVVTETKVVEKISDYERGQMLNYLRITKLRVGVILNFKHPKLEFERLVL